MAVHYGVAVLPARAAKPRDKAKVEVGVQIAQRWILACLRNRRFYSLGALNEAVAELLERLNTRPFVKLEGCRRSAFEALDRPAMRPLPARRYELTTWARGRVNIDYHVDFDHHPYSVPHQLVGAKVEIRTRPLDCVSPQAEDRATRGRDGPRARSGGRRWRRAAAESPAA